MTVLSATYRNIDERKRCPSNPRARSTKQFGRMIKEFGFIDPVMVDANDRILARHWRVRAAKELFERLNTYRAQYPHFFNDQETTH